MSINIEQNYNNSELKIAPDTTLEAIGILLNFYSSNFYSNDAEDVELAVTLPEIIARGLYLGKVVEILQPLYVYWQQNITPAVQEYQQNNDRSEYCGFSPKHYSTVDGLEF
jgi:hypothetical protein